MRSVVALPCYDGFVDACGLGGGNERPLGSSSAQRSDVKLQAAFTRERTRGAPLAAMHVVLPLSVCKRRDAVRLALDEPARPAGAAFGGLSASASSWAANPLASDAIVFGMRTNPTPENSPFGISSQGAIVQTDTNRPVLSDTLEAKGGMPRIGDEEPIIVFGKFLNFGWQLPEKVPEVRARVVIQNFVLLPCICASRAAAKIRSSLPDAASCSICLSHSSQSRSSSHVRNSANSDGDSCWICCSSCSTFVMIPT